MNYYEHHLGDYDSATAHLSWAEDCAYRRLICLYYRTEAPIPLDIKQAFRLVRAVTKQEREAVEQVLGEFFDKRDDGWHNARCDADIEKFRDLEPEREAKRENAKERQRRARERRSELFESLRGHNIVPAYDTPTKALESLLSQALSRVTPAQPVTAPVTPVTCDDTVTHTHYPLPTTQSQKDKGERSAQPRAAAASPPSRGTRLPAGWVPEPVHMAFAESQGLRNGKAIAELEKFRDYWSAQPGQKGVKSDWPATWRNWVRRAVENAAASPKAAGAVLDLDGVH